MPIQLDGPQVLVPTKVIIAKVEIMLAMADQVLFRFRIGNITVVILLTMVEIMEQVEEE
jgi:hypothetical protein